jgi:Fur family transcriptional regulator, stress-responsive regulator
VRTPEEQLRGAGLRVTAPRVAVLRVLREAHDHPRVEDVITRVRADGVPVSVQGAYDVCEALRRAGLVRRIDLGAAPARYEARVGDNHHHLVCRGCGATWDVDCAIGSAPCMEPLHDDHGFRVDQAEVTYWGLCPACQTRDEGTRA